jgi:hypothetical protein
MGFPFEHGNFVQRDLGRPRKTWGSWLEFNVVLLLHGLPDPDPDPDPEFCDMFEVRIPCGASGQWALIQTGESPHLIFDSSKQLGTGDAARDEGLKWDLTVGAVGF